MPKDLTETELRAWQALLHAHHDLVQRLDLELREEHGITFGEYDVLLRLARVPGAALRMTNLADRVMLSPSGVTRLVDRLMVSGFVRREADQDDARATLASSWSASRRTNPLTISRSTSRVTPLGDSITRSARLVIRRAAPGTRARRRSTSYSPKVIPCSSLSSRSSL